MTTKPKVKKIKAVGHLLQWVHFQKTGWAQIKISGFKRDKDVKDFGKLLLKLFLTPLPTPKKSNSKPTKRGGRK